MKLYLVQHAESKSKEEDPSRSLTDRGWRESELMARFIQNNEEVQVFKIIHSGKLRSAQTAQNLAGVLKPVAGTHPEEGLNPNDDVDIIFQKIQDLNENIMIVGHLPHLANLVMRMVTALADSNMEPPVQFHNSGIACLERDSNGKWKISWIVIPSLLAPRG